MVGTITDGDIRRGLLRGMSLGNSVEEILCREPLVVPPELARDAVLHLMRTNSFNAVPVVDKERRVVGLHLRDELSTPVQRQNLMVIMVGGQGNRLRPQTDNVPKAMLSVDGKPMVGHIIQRAKSAGFRHFVLAVHHLGHMVENYFGDGSRWHIHIDYLREESPQGTAGAIGLLDPLPKTPFLVTNGDVLTDIRYGELLDYHVTHSATATMAVRMHEWQNPFGVVQTKGVDIVRLEEKPIVRSCVNAGVYVLEPTAIKLLDAREICDMPTLFSRLRASGNRTIVYPMHEPWLDVGRADDLEQARTM